MFCRQLESIKSFTQSPPLLSNKWPPDIQDMLVVTEDNYCTYLKQHHSLMCLCPNERPHFLSDAVKDKLLVPFFVNTALHKTVTILLDHPRINTGTLINVNK